MTNYYLSLNLGAVDYGPDQVDVSLGSIATQDFEVRILSTNTPTNLQIILALEAFRRYLEDGRFTTLPFLG